MHISTEGSLGKEFSQNEEHPSSQMPLCGRKTNVIAKLVSYCWKGLSLFFFFFLSLCTLCDVALPPCFCQCWHFFFDSTLGINCTIRACPTPSAPLGFWWVISRRRLPAQWNGHWSRYRSFTGHSCIRFGVHLILFFQKYHEFLGALEGWSVRAPESWNCTKTLKRNGCSSPFSALQ